MQQPQLAFSEAETPPFNQDITHDYSLLFLASLAVATAAYIASALLTWPTLCSRKKKAATQHRSTSVSKAPGASPANSCSTQPSPATPARSAAAASSELLSVDEQFEQLLQQLQPEVHQQLGRLNQSLPNMPYTFRAPDFTADDSNVEIFASPQPESRAKHRVQFVTPQPADRVPQRPQQDRQPAEGWDPELLRSNSPYIDSIEALQCSPVYRSHISTVRGRHLRYETAEAHKLNIYKALRKVDPPGFQQLFSRKDIKEYDAVTPSRLLSLFECITSGALTLGLLLLPSLLSTLNSYVTQAALLWCSLYLFSVSKGCLSPIAWLLSIYSTHGEYQMLPARARLLAAVFLEAASVVLTAGMGWFITLLCRMLTQQRQSFGERVMQLVPLMEVVGPMHFNRLPPAAASSAALFD